MIQISRKFKALGVPYRADVANLFPQAKQLDDGTLVLPHDVASTMMLRNLGLQVPAPMLEHYDWAGGSPFDVQRKTCALMTVNQRAYVLNGMGTGKTKCALWAFDYLRSAGLAKRMLVVAPLSTLTPTWVREAFATVPHLTVVTLVGDKAKRLKRLNEDADIYVINHDGIKVLFDELMKRGDIDTMTIDELAAYRNGRADRSKTMQKLARKMVWAWGMTGSPTPNSPTDAWAQCRILTPHTVPAYFKRFEDDTTIKVTQFKRIPKDNAIETVAHVMQPSVRYTLDEVVELPEAVERVVELDLGSKQERVYKEMAATAATMVASSEITAMNAGAVLSKLLQISVGYVYDREGNVHDLGNAARQDAVVDTVLSTDRKVIVFVPFKHALAGIADRLTREGIDVATVSGDTPRTKRDEIFKLFQQTDRIRVIVAHPQCMAHGLTLTAADTVIWFGPTPDLEIFEQANARIRRVGQKHKQLYLYFQSTAAERRTYAKLRAKQKVQDNLLELLAELS